VTVGVQRMVQWRCAVTVGVQRMVQWRCAVTVGVKELRQQNCRSRSRPSYLPAIWFWSYITICYCTLPTQTHYVNTQLSSMNVEDENFFNDKTQFVNKFLWHKIVTMQCVMETSHNTTSVENFVECMIDHLTKINQLIYTVQSVTKAI